MSSLSKREIERILRTLERDREFRYALMGLLGFKELLERFEKLEERQLRLEERFSHLEERQIKLEERFQLLENVFSGLRRGIYAWNGGSKSLRSGSKGSSNGSSGWKRGSRSLSRGSRSSRSGSGFWRSVSRSSSSGSYT